MRRRACRADAQYKLNTSSRTMMSYYKDTGDCPSQDQGSQYLVTVSIHPGHRVTRTAVVS